MRNNGMAKQLPDATTAADDSSVRTYTRRELVVRRVVFWGGIVVWVLVLSLPLLVVMLAMRGEITVGVPGDYPDSEVRVWMIMERDQRGVGVSRPVVASRTDSALQVQMNVRYLLWEGESEAARYCVTYTRAGEGWQMAGTVEGACSS